MNLAAMQRDFRGWLTDAPAAMEQWVDADARPGLAVYHNAYRVQLVDCLRDTFEKTLLWLGDDAFTDAAREHIESTPPHGWTLGVYGDGFGQTLGGLYPDDPEVAELAWLDWALGRAFEGGDAAPVTPHVLAEVDWDTAGLVLSPTMQIAAARTNAGAIWSALSAQDDPPVAAMLPELGAMVVWRQDFTPCFRTVGAIEAFALERIVAGATFGTLCHALIERCGEDAGVSQAGALLGQWIGDGLIIGISLYGQQPPAQR
jgi:hypothetical protein